MSDLPVEVPAQVWHQNYKNNGILVQGGNNWDFSRSAVETPIAILKDPAPVKRIEAVELLETTPYMAKHGIPLEAPKLTISFARNSSLLTAESKKLLRNIPKGVPIVLAGHADNTEKNPTGISKARVDSISKYLKSLKKEVSVSKHFGDELSLSDSPLYSDKNRRVEIFYRGY